VKEIGLINLSPVKNSMNKLREHKMGSLQVSKHCYVQEELVENYSSFVMMHLARWNKEVLRGLLLLSEFFAN
jgi:hypothetical protein